MQEQGRPQLGYSLQTKKYDHLLDYLMTCYPEKKIETI